MEVVLDIFENGLNLSGLETVILLDRKSDDDTL